MRRKSVVAIVLAVLALGGVLAVLAAPVPEEGFLWWDDGAGGDPVYREVVSEDEIECSFYYDLEARCAGQVVATQLITTDIQPADEPGTGFYAGPDIWSWESDDFTGTIESWMRGRWECNVLTQSVHTICPDHVQDAEDFCLWGEFEGTMETGYRVYLPLVSKGTGQ